MKNILLTLATFLLFQSVANSQIIGNWSTDYPVSGTNADTDVFIKQLSPYTAGLQRHVTYATLKSDIISAIVDGDLPATITRDTEWDTFAEINAASTDTDAVLDTDIGGTVQAYSVNLDGFAAKAVPTGVVVGSTDAITLTNKTITFANNTLTNVMSLTTAQSVTAGIKKTFQADATNSGLRLAGVAANPSTLVAGDLWYRTDTETLSYRGASAAKNLATRQVYVDEWIGAGAMIPATTAGATTATPQTTTNAVNYDTMVFSGTADNDVWFVWWMPDNWDLGTIKAKFVVEFDAAATEDCVFSIGGVSVADAGALDVAVGTLQQVVIVSDATPTGKQEVSAATAAITLAGTPAIGKPTYFRVRREAATDAADNDATDVQLIGVKIQYQTLTTAAAAW